MILPFSVSAAYWIYQTHVTLDYWIKKCMLMVCDGIQNYVTNFVFFFAFHDY